jgi:hypothetical protein
LGTKHFGFQVPVINRTKLTRIATKAANRSVAFRFSSLLNDLLLDMVLKLLKKSLVCEAVMRSRKNGCDLAERPRLTCSILDISAPSGNTLTDGTGQRAKNGFIDGKQIAALKGPGRVIDQGAKVFF